MEIKIYTTPTCPYCRMTKKFLDDNKVDYKELNVATDAAARNELLSKGQMSVPIIEIDGEAIVGFNEKRLREKLGL